jgi:hypothetical protein
VTPAGGAIARVLEAVTVDLPTGYTWVGERFDVAATAPAPEQKTRAIVEALARRLYDDFYCAGGVAPASDLAHNGALQWRALGDDALLDPDLGGSRREGGWTVDGTTGDEVTLTKSGLTICAPTGKITSGSWPLRPGAAVTVAIPAGVRGAHHTTIHGEGSQPGRAGDVDRFYWNVHPAGRRALVTDITARLNGAGVPFRLKCFADSTLLRCDAAVLYVPRSRRHDVTPLLREAHDEVEQGLRDLTPVFTRRLARGLGFAEDPGDPDESFGTHRCRILAGAIVTAESMSITATSGRADVVEGAFRHAGVALEHPYLRPGSDPLRAPEPFAP